MLISKPAPKRSEITFISKETFWKQRRMQSKNQNETPGPYRPFYTPWDSKSSMQQLPQKTIQGSRNQTQVLSTCHSTLHKRNGWIKHKLLQLQAGRVSNLGHWQGESSFRSSLLHTPEGAVDFDFNLETSLQLSLGRRQRKVLCHVLTSVKSLKKHVSLSPRHSFDTEPSWDLQQWLLYLLPLALPQAVQLPLCQHNYTPEWETEGHHYLPWTTSARRWLLVQANHFSLHHLLLSQGISPGEPGKWQETKHVPGAEW